MRRPIASLLMAALMVMLPTAGFALTSSDFTQLVGSDASGKLGRTIASGDFNGDGYADLVAGAPNNPVGYIAIVYGSSSLPSATTLSTSNADIITGNGSTDFFGVSLATGDMNGDGYDDLAIGATGDTTGGAANSGAVYLIYGRSAHIGSGAASSLGAKFYVGSGFQTGTSIAMGNSNGDAYDDLLVGSSNDAATGGSASLVYGQSSSYSGTNSIAGLPKFTGESGGNQFGRAVGFGDLNGDGYDDAVIGAPQNNDGGTGAGSVYVFMGQSASYTGSTAASGVFELTGEASGDQAGTNIHVADVTGDGYADLLISAPGNDDAAGSAGAIYLVTGSGSFATSGTVSLSTSTYTEWTGVASLDAVGTISSADLNGDGVRDVVIGSSAASSSAGAVYVMTGTAASGSLSSATTITSASTQAFGVAVGYGDLNGDGFEEMLVGANTYSSNTGAAYIGAFLVDSDLDGKAGSGLYTSIDSSFVVDCSDTDATVSENQTYYVDEDGDGLGTTVEGTPVCAGTAPDGYADNSDDADDSVANNATYYSEDPSDGDTAEASITNVAGGANGTIIVTYADDTEFTYSVFDTTSSKNTLVQQYPNSGYGVVLDRKGKKIKLVNLYTGAVTSSKSLSSKAVDSAKFLLKDVRQDNKTEAVVTLLRNSKASVYIVKVTKSTGSMKVKDHASVNSKKVATNKTKVKKSTITLRSSQNATIAEFKVNSSYQLVLQ